MARDPATGDTARTGPYGTPCPATDTTARDDHARRRAIRHVTTILVAGPATGDTARDDHLVPDDVW